MKAAFKKNGIAYLKDIELCPLRPQDVRLRATACGVCGTDIQQDSSEPDEEVPFGHEVAGTIIEVGSAVQHLSVGQKVVLDSATPCGRCNNCRNAKQELCTDIQSFYFIGSFGFAEEMIAPAISVIPCEDLPPDIAVLQEPLGVAIDLVRLAEIEIGCNVLIMGQGPIGLMALALAKKSGAHRVFVSDFKTRTARAKMAEQFGADLFIDPLESPLEDHDFGCEIDRVLVTSPPKTLKTAFRVAANGGIISFIGIAHAEGAFCTFDANEFHFKKLQLRASFASPALFGPQQTYLDIKAMPFQISLSKPRSNLTHSRHYSPIHLVRAVDEQMSPANHTSRCRNSNHGRGI